MLAASGGSRAEMSMKFFGYFTGLADISRFLCTIRIERSKYLPSSLSVPLRLLSPTFRLYLLTRVSALVVFLTLLFGLHLLHLFLLFSSPFRSTSCSFTPFSSSLVRSSFLPTLLHSCEIAFKLFGFLTRRRFIVWNPCCIAQRECWST